MRLLIVLSFIFLFHFVSYVTGFEYSNEAICASVNPQDSEIFYTHTWLIKDFQELYNELYDDSEIFSEKIFTPIMLNNQREYHGWRVSIYIKPNKCINIFLTAFQTDYEKQNELNERRIRFKFEMYLNNNKFLGQSGIGNNLFSFTNNTIKFSNQFCVVYYIFPNGNLSIKTNLIIRVHFYGDENITNSNNDPPNFFEQYFDSDAFNDIIFKFSCGSEIRASSIFLAIKSSPFKELLKSHKKGSEKVVIHMKEVSYHCFYKLLYFIYSGKLDNNLSYEELIELYNESNSKEINDLKEIVSCKILNFVNENTWDELLLLGWKTKNKVIKNAAMKFVIDNWMKVKDTDKMRKIETLNNIEWLEELIITKLFNV